MRQLVLAAAVFALVWVPLDGRASDTPLQTATVAWDRGDYVAALTGYLRILDDSPTREQLETIALQTGELYQTIELTADGDSPQFSPDGRVIVYETGTHPRRSIRLVSTGNPPKVVTSIDGFRAVFSPDGARMAYLQVSPTPELEAAARTVDAGAAATRAQRLAAFTDRIALESALVVRDVSSGRETRLAMAGLRKLTLAFSQRGVLFTGGPPDGPVDIYAAPADGGAPVPLTSGEGDKLLAAVSPVGNAVTYTVRRTAGRAGRDGADEPQFFLLRTADGVSIPLAGAAPGFSPDGRTLAYVRRAGAAHELRLADVAAPSDGVTIRTGPDRLDAPVFSPDGERLAFQVMAREDWDVYVIGRDGETEVRLTRDVQHDLLPRFLANDRLVVMSGESRHRRSHLYDLRTGEARRIFHNNTVRTIAPEYAWVPAPDGRRLLIVAERDGNTVSPERGVYLVDFMRTVDAHALRARLRASLDAETALRARTAAIFAPIADEVRAVVGEASIPRVYEYQRALFEFDSKHITRPGNRLAGEYLFGRYSAFGYTPELQWFAARAALGGQTANVLATLRGTENPELVYVVSSHYDSVAAGPGADDDSSGTAALLETARLLARRPQPATIVFASFTGEESGLLGSREFVRQAVANDVRIVGALNNDMVGWANDHRLDNTIRYSNTGIRDVQHGAAIHFTDLITYDTLYYKSTDAAAYYEAYGDIVGGIGSYPVLGNPHYHQSHDVLETINHRLVTEVAKTTAASLMLLASSPSRLTGLKVDSLRGGTTTLSWTPSPEKGVTGYIVAWGPAADPLARRVTVTKPSAELAKIAPGTVVSVKGVNARGLEGWDWARVTVH